MNDLFLKYLLEKNNYIEEDRRVYHPTFLDKDGAGKTSEDEIIKKLISTCEEGVDYTKV